MTSLKPKLSIQAIFLLVSSFGYAQIPTFDLEKCMNYAVENETSARNVSLDEEIAKLKVMESLGQGLPQISGTANVQHNPELPRFFSQYREGSEFGITDKDAQSLGIQEGDVYGATNFFQLKSNGDVRLSASQLIFNGSYLVGLKAARKFKKLAEKQKKYTQSELKAAVAKAYFNVLINEERWGLYESNIERTEKLYKEVQELYENGFAEKIEVDRLKVMLNNAQTQKSNYESLSNLSMLLLKFQMNYPLDSLMQIEGSISDFTEGEIQNVPQEYDLADRFDYQTLLVNKDLQELNLKNIYAGAFPVIEAFGTVGASTQSSTFWGLFKQESNFGELSGVGPDKWFSYSVVGLRLNWSLFTGLQRSAQIQQQKIEIMKLNNNLSQFERKVRVEVKQQGIQLRNANENLAIQKENMELAQNIFNISEIKYKEGVGSSLEVVNADNELKQAQTNYFNALFDAVIAKIDLTRAVGRRD